uniref:Uncharacterized protein n=1 Tax=Physcomitrium patens TaxID=3218 RepID=A0A2K1KX47_PHYPA|nr:hypothetical protein PHYPA_005358 [Physcomitrium patens]
MQENMMSRETQRELEKKKMPTYMCFFYFRQTNRTSQGLLNYMGFGILRRSDAGVPAVKEMHDESYSEAYNQEYNDAIEQQSGNEVDDAQAEEALEELLPTNAIRVGFVMRFCLPPLGRTG